MIHPVPVLCNRVGLTNAMGHYFYKYAVSVVDTTYKGVGQRLLTSLKKNFVSHEEIFEHFVQEVINTNIHEFLHFTFDFIEYLSADSEIEEMIVENVTYYSEQLLKDVDISVLRTESELAKKGFVISDRVHKSLCGVLA